MNRLQDIKDEDLMKVNLELYGERVGACLPKNADHISIIADNIERSDIENASNIVQVLTETCVVANKPVPSGIFCGVQCSKHSWENILSFTKGLRKGAMEAFKESIWNNELYF